MIKKNTLMNRSHGIMFHHFHDDNIHIKGQGSINSEEFEKLLNYYQRKYKILSAEEYLKKTISGNIKSDEVCITFDDALKCQYDIAYPILKERGINAFWFIYTSPILGIAEKLEIYRHFRFSKFSDIDEFYKHFFRVTTEKESELKLDLKKKMEMFNSTEYLKDFPFYTVNDKIFRYTRDHILGEENYNLIMDFMLDEFHYDLKESSKHLWITKENIKDLHKNGEIIGLHSHTHNTMLGNCTYEQQLKEYKNNIEILTSIISDNIYTVSYPCNSYNDDTIRIMKYLGIKLGFRANIVDNYNSIYELPREDHTNIIRRIKDENNSFYK